MLVRAVLLQPEISLHSGWSKSADTNSVIVPPWAKFGFSESQGSGHW
jgi:hypothetical protein